MYGLMENAIYGGRVDNTFDMRVLKTYLRQCFDDRTIPGQAGTPRRGGKKWEGLPSSPYAPSPSGRGLG